MILALVRKLLRDLRIAWFVAALLLFLFQILWSRITMRVSTQILDSLQQMNIPLEKLQNLVLGKNDVPAQMVQAMIGGEDIEINRASDMMSIAYVHPLVLTILCLWAIGRASIAIAGEIDRGTMELLLAQPIRRTQVVLAHLLVDAIVFPALALALWMGTYCGTWWMGLQAETNPMKHVDPWRFVQALPCILALLFSVSGLTMWLSAMGRSRGRVGGLAITLVLSMFLINVLGQIWEEQLGWLRPWTIFYHYRPQPIIQRGLWNQDSRVLLHLLTLAGVGVVGYLLAWTTFRRRDLPAPL
jgi:ABC-2 type transport system permease protein